MMSIQPLIPDPQHPSGEPSRLDPLVRNVIGLILLFAWLLVFTIGSQVPSSRYDGVEDANFIVLAWNMFMLTLTRPIPSICILGTIASCLGMWRHRFLSNRRQANPASVPIAETFSCYIASAIAGLITSLVVMVVPGLCAQTSIFSFDQNTYLAFSLTCSVLAYQAGYDESFFNRIRSLLTDRILRLHKRPAPTHTSTDPADAQPILDVEEPAQVEGHVVHPAHQPASEPTPVEAHEDQGVPRST